MHPLWLNHDWLTEESMVFILDGCSFYYALQTYGLNQASRFVESIWSHWKFRQIRRRKRPILHHTCETCSELPSHISTMDGSMVLCWDWLVNGSKYSTYLFGIIDWLTYSLTSSSIIHKINKNLNLMIHYLSNKNHCLFCLRYSYLPTDWQTDSLTHQIASLT